MTFGMQIFNGAGGLNYSTTDVTWNQVDMFTVPGGSSVTRTFPALQGREVLTAQVMINPPPLNRRAIAHTISVNGTRVTVSGGSEDSYVLVLMR